MRKPVEQIEEATILFAGDSGDGSQTIGTQMTETTALIGNDVATLPDYPAEIRAPAGSLAGVSGFQLHFSSEQIHTPGDLCDVLVAMNPAALKVHLNKLKPNGILIVNVDNFADRNLRLAGYESNPLEDDALTKYQVFQVELTQLTRKALETTDLTTGEIDRCKNFFALGMILWFYNRPMEYTMKWIKVKFAKKPEYIESNILALRAGNTYCEATEQFAVSYDVKPAVFEPGTYRNIEGNMATVLGLVAASHQSGLPLVYGSYPITPASDILHGLAQYRNFGVVTMQMEDEIAAVGVAIGAAFSGALGVTGSSGPGLALKSEAINLAMIAELPIVICNIQRAGPSTGMPTKTEQSDLLQMFYGRNGESPVPIIASSRPYDCFEAVYEACRIAVKYRTPVIFLSDLYIGMGAEPWKIPQLSELPEIRANFAVSADTNNGFEPYLRDPKTLARPWAKPGTSGLEHRIGGLEKSDVTGHVSYDAENHEKMVEIRAEKVARIADDIPPTEIFGAQEGEILLLGWGGTYGAIRTVVENCVAEGLPIGHVHLRHLNPFPNDLDDILQRFKKILIPELNSGQLLQLIRSTYLINAVGLNKVQGQPFHVFELHAKIDEILKEIGHL
ncbi:MAG: 2-oxoacid:acceptor oxidoreductase subunit alpha [Candidatus Poribacteria bacterium]|nr:2-oxoacid:acceptor oxidoreductase subunit alpha [Candidatus Poribacteria bacterium]MDD9972964.1 2-oxoacid:acceptor oxidoreductase subunit alpha [Candidatus Poribacteria bacterium]MDE0325443.1 2-oxoacid:acceptor oxidoreductase subunit alpha [Candidatus Poribacteria bacterium]